MIFNHVKLPELEFDLKAVTTESGRKYTTPNGEKYSSITTVLSAYNKKAIMEWRKRVGEEQANKISSQASRRGTSVHDVCEKFLLNELSDMKIQMMMPNVKEMFLQLKPELMKNIGNIYCLEQALYSHKLKVAGRVDCIAEWKGKLSVIDFKTSGRLKDKDHIKNYFMQCSAYAIMFEEITGLPIEQIVVAIAVNDETVPQIFEETKDKYIDDLLYYVKKHQDIAV